nr:ribonuclease H-like domain-containing protein [Tanacetum cinerariifolium]
MEFESAQNNITAKLPIFKLGEYEMWVIRIKQYFQVQDYALWEVIENEKTSKKNDVKARSLLLMALPNEHQLTFSQYNDAKTMFAAIETRFRDVKNYVGTSTGAQNMAFMTAPSTSSTNDVNTANPAYKASIVSLNVNTTSPQDLEQIHKDDLEAIDLRWQLSLLSIRAKRECRAQRNQNATAYKRGLATVEEQLVTYKKNEVLFSEEVAVLKREVACKDYEINVLKCEFEKVKQEKDGIEVKIEKFDNASKSLDKFIWSQITNNSKKGLGYHAIPPSYNGPTKLDLSYFGLDEFKKPAFKGYGPRDSHIEDRLILLGKKGSMMLRPHHVGFGDLPGLMGKPRNDDKGFIDSRCSRHMTRNIAYLSDFKEFDRGYVTFRGGAHGGRISAWLNLVELTSEVLIEGWLIVSINSQKGIEGHVTLNKSVLSVNPLRNSKEFRTLRYLSLVVSLKKVGDEAVDKELGDRMERAATTASSLEAEQDSEIEITTTIDGRVKSITKASIRRHLKLEDYKGISNLPNTENFEQLALIGVIQQSYHHQFHHLQGYLHHPMIHLSYEIKLTYGAAYSKLIIKTHGRNEHEVESDFDFTNAEDISTANVPDTTAGPKISTASPEDKITETSDDSDDITLAETLIEIKRSVTKPQKGKGVLLEEEYVKVKRRDRGLTQIESDAELAQRLYEEELAEVDIAQKERQKQEEATIAVLTEDFDEIQARMDDDHELAARLTYEEPE